MARMPGKPTAERERELNQARRAQQMFADPPGSKPVDGRMMFTPRRAQRQRLERKDEPYIEVWERSANGNRPAKREVRDVWRDSLGRFMKAPKGREHERATKARPRKLGR